MGDRLIMMFKYAFSTRKTRSRIAGFARLLLLAALPLWGLQSLNSTPVIAQNNGNGETEECRDLKHASQQLARAMRQLRQEDEELAFSVLSLHTGVSVEDLSSANVNMNLLSRAAVISELTGLSFDESLGLVSG